MNKRRVGVQGAVKFVWDIWQKPTGKTVAFYGDNPAICNWSFRLCEHKYPEKATYEQRRRGGFAA